MRTISLVQNALRRGDLIRPEACEECGESGRSITAAHADYSRPLDVRWLCRPCHGRWDQAQPKTSPEALAAVAASWIPWAGTSRPGEQHHGAKLTEADVLLMRSLYAQGGTTQRELAGRFGIHPTLVSRIVLRKSWKHI